VEKMKKKLMNSLNPKEKEVKKMKKLVFFALVAIFIVALAGVGMADVINPGPFGAKYVDQSFASLPLGAGPIWGVFSLSDTRNLTDGNPENQSLAGVPYYQQGADGFNYFGVYGGLIPIGVNPTNPSITDLGSVPGNPAYLNIYAVPVADGDVYSAAVAAGPNPGGMGAPGTFATAITTAPGATLFLSLAPGGGGEYMSTYFGDLIGTVEEFTLLTPTHGSTLAYWDVVGGSGASLIDPDSFPFFPNLYTGAVKLDGNGDPVYADLRILSDLTSQAGSPWTTSSEDPVTGIGTTIPEPSTLILLGAGLFGIGILRRKSTKS
jgi:hypothetical protein